MKTRGGVRQLTWIVVLSVLTLVAFALPAAGPAHCESIREALAQLEALRQQVNQAMVAYQQAAPEVRAMVNSMMASQYVPALKRWYNALPSGERAALDKVLRNTGYSFAQLVQMSSTVPGAVKALNLLVDAVEVLYGGKRTVTPSEPKGGAGSGTPTAAKPGGAAGSSAPAQPAKQKTAPKPSPTPPPSGAASSGPLAQRGTAGPEGGTELRLKLGWVLFSRTDLTDEQAQALYEQKVKKRMAELDEDLAAAKKRRDSAERKLKLVDEAGEKTGAEKVRKALQEDLQEAKKERSQALKDLGALFLKEAAGKASEKVESFLDLKDVGTGAYHIEALTLKSNRTREDWEKAGEGLVGILAATSKQAGLKVVGPVATVAELAADAIYLQLADRRVKLLENSLAQNNAHEYRSRLLQQVRMESDKVKVLEGEKAMLSSGKYLDLEAIR